MGALSRRFPAVGVNPHSLLRQTFGDHRPVARRSLLFLNLCSARCPRWPSTIQTESKREDARRVLHLIRCTGRNRVHHAASVAQTEVTDSVDRRDRTTSVHTTVSPKTNKEQQSMNLETPQGSFLARHATFDWPWPRGLTLRVTASTGIPCFIPTDGV